MLKNDRVVLRAWQEADIEPLSRLRNDIALQEQLMSQPRPNSAESVRQWLVGKSDQPDVAFFVITDAPSGAVAGYLQYVDVARQNGHASLGICVAHAFQGLGHAAAAMTLAEAYLKRVFATRKVMLKVYADNARAIRFYEKHGFAECGRLKRHALRDQDFHDVLMMEKFLDGKAGPA